MKMKIIKIIIFLLSLIKSIQNLNLKYKEIEEKIVPSERTDELPNKINPSGEKITNNLNTKNIFHMSKLKRNNTVLNQRFKKRDVDSKNKTMKRVSNNNLKASNQTNQGTNIFVGNCFMKIDYHYFDLYPIEKYESEFTLKYSDENPLKFNICKDLTDKCQEDPALILDPTECIAYANSSKIEKSWKLSHYVNSKGDNTTLLTLSLPKGQECEEGENYSIDYVLECDPKQEKLKIINEDEFDADSCSNTIRMKSKYACDRIDIIPWYLKFGFNVMIIAGVCIGLGLFLSVFGAKCFKYIIVILIIAGGGIVARTIIGNHFQMSNLVLWIISFSISILVGVTAFFIFQIIVGIAFLILSYFIAQFLLGILIIYIYMDPLILFFILWISSMVILGLLVYLFNRILEILLTSMIGSYLLIRGISFFLGGFPDEEQMSYLFYYKELNQIKRIVTGSAFKFFIGMALFMIISIIVQTFTFTKEEEEPKRATKSGTENKRGKRK